MKNINQAVILCGGKGTRLGKLTKNLPKPMIKVADKPFLEHLIIQLKKNGVKNILLLIGYKGEVIKNYFNTGKKLGIKINYSYLPPEADTGQRLYEAKKKLKKNFILLYSDNYTSLNLHKLNKHFIVSGKKILLSLVKKKNGNCYFNKKNNNVSYTNIRSKKSSHVEIGYMIINSDILKHLNKKTKNFSKFLLLLSKKKLISGIEIKNGYLSIGDRKRLLITKNYFKNNNIILIDRDGVINTIPKNERYLTSPSKLKINSNFLKLLPKNAKYICITNQAGIATGELKKQNLIKINKKIKLNLKKLKLTIIDFFISTHHFKSNSFYRKPNPGLFLQAANKYKFILDKTFYIGDDIRDIEAAYNANTSIKYIGKKNINLKHKKKYKFILLKKNMIEIINDKKKFKF